MSIVDLALACLTYFAVKHTIADYFLQTRFQWKNKGRYGHPGGLLHAGIHVLLSVPAFLILAPPSATFAICLLAAEYLVHYHCDWAKEQVCRAWRLTNVDAGFWRAFGVDQLVHALTYVAMVEALLLARP